MILSKLSNFVIPVMLASLLLGACNTSKEQTQILTENASTQDTTDQEFIEAPDFTLKTMEGNSFTLSNHKGKVVVLNFWATWCPPCRKEIPDFMELHKEMKDDGVLFAGVSVDEGGWDDVRPFANDMEINYPVMVDDGSVSTQYGPIRVIPTTFIINKKGQVEYVAPGMLTKEKLQPILEKLSDR